MDFTKEEQDQIKALKNYRPFMRTFGAKSPTGEFITWFAGDMRRAKNYVKKGWLVAEAQR